MRARRLRYLALRTAGLCCSVGWKWMSRRDGFKRHEKGSRSLNPLPSHFDLEPGPVETRRVCHVRRAFTIQ